MSRPLLWFLVAPAAACALALGAPAARAGVVNPDISVIGQPLARWTDDAADPGRRRWTLDPGETELVFDAALNPYARGWFTLAIGDEGLELEEGFFDITRGLPGGLALKGGKYRAGFGRLNPAHPHTYPFAERFRLLAAYLPGEEAFNETGVQVSWRTSLPRDAALTVSADLLQGDSFRVPRESSGAANDPLEAGAGDDDRATEPRAAGLGRVSLFAPVGERSGLEFGASFTTGANNVAAATRTTVWGVDAKAKWWTAPRAYLLIQGEWLGLDREDAGWDEAAAAYTSTSVKPAGGYLFADFNWDARWNVGASYERFRQPAPEGTRDQAIGVYAGLALMEETTAFRLGWERYLPGAPAGAAADPEAANSFTLRVLFSMGPHKAHQF
jgi:hypothetical protein